MAPVDDPRGERGRRVLLAASALLLCLGVAQVASPALGHAATVSLVTARASPGDRAPPTSAPTLPSPPAHSTRSAVVPTIAPLPRSALATDSSTPASVPGLHAAAESPVAVPTVAATTPGGFGCDAALAYLVANQAPGFVDVCAPQAAGPGRAGYTVATTTNGVTTGTIYVSCPAPIVYQNEASNSVVFAGLSSAAIDPWGGVPSRQCPAGDIAPG